MKTILYVIFMIRNASFNILKDISLENRLYVINDMTILDYLVDNGFVPKGFWSDEKEEKYGKALHKFAKQLTKYQIKEMKQWEKDGRPK